MLEDLAPVPLGRESARSLPSPRHSGMPLTGLFVFLYVVAVVLFAQSSETSLIATVLGFTLAYVFVVELVGRHRGFCFPAPLVWFLLFMCFCMFQMIWSPGSLAMLLTLTQLLILSFIVVNYIVFGSGDRAIEYAFYVAVILTFAYTVVFKSESYGGRVGSTLFNANTYAYVLMLGALFSIRRVLLNNINHTLSFKNSIALFAYFALCVYGIVYLTGSRKGILLTIAAGVVLALHWVWRQPIRRRPLLSASIVVVFALVGYALYTSPQFSRIVDLSNFFGGRSVVDTGLVKRSSMYRDAIALWLQRPFSGWGLDQFRVVSGWSTYSHDNYVELLANQGLIGLFAYVMIYVSTFVSLVRSYFLSRDPQVFTELFWALTVLGVQVAWDAGAVSYYDKLTWIILSVVVAVSVRARVATWAASSSVVCEQT